LHLHYVVEVSTSGKHPQILTTKIMFAFNWIPLMEMLCQCMSWLYECTYTKVSAYFESAWKFCYWHCKFGWCRVSSLLRSNLTTG